MAVNWIKKSLEIGLKGAIAAAALLLLISRFEDSHYQGLLSINWHSAGLYVTIFLLLWLFNLWLDALIWQSVNHFVEDISLKRAFKTNFVSYALAFITPANSGEVAGRYIMLNNKNDRRKTLFLIFWSHFPRLIVKVGLGGTALLLVGWLTDRVGAWLVYSVLGVGIPALGIFYFLFIRIQRWLHERNIRKVDLSNYILNNRPLFREKARLLIMALVKYLIYNFQFIILLLMWGGGVLTWELFFSVIVFYFITAVIPTFAAVDFLVKAALAIYIFDESIANESLLINAAFITWLFNIALPALGGVGVILKANLLTSVKKRFSRGNLYEP